MFFTNEFYQALNTSDPFATLMQQPGHVYRHVKNRKTIRFELAGKAYFAKLFFGIGLGEICKNLIKGQWPVITAAHERKALDKLALLGIRAPKVVAYGSSGSNPLRKQSFIVMEAIEPSVSLEDYLHQWSKTPLAIRRALIHQVAAIARKIHQHGIQHRDFYICHFLLTTPLNLLNADNIELALIDLHRARFRNPLPQSWVVKDLAALYFSVLSSSLTMRDYLRFVKEYTQQPLRTTLHDPMWQKVEAKALRLYKKTYSTLPNVIANRMSAQSEQDKYISQQSYSKRIIIQRARTSPQLLTLLGDPESIFTRAEVKVMKESPLCTLACMKVDGREIVIKRYRWRQGWRGFTRLFRPSRAARCWNFAEIMNEYNIPTPPPIALVEKRWGWLRRDAYYITEYCHGPSLRDYVTKAENAEQLPKLQENWQELHQRLTQARLSHGDTNLQNFLVTSQGLMLLDLDTMRRHFFPHRLGRRRERDNQRFLREWGKYADNNFTS